MMSTFNSPHVIRLRGPWEVEPIPPSDAGGGGGLRLSRAFGRPTNLSPTDLVVLVLTDVRLRASLEVNGVDFGEIAAATPEVRFPIQQVLTARNRLCLEFPLRIRSGTSSSFNPQPQARDAANLACGCGLNDANREVVVDQILNQDGRGEDVSSGQGGEQSFGRQSDRPHPWLGSARLEIDSSC